MHVLGQTVQEGNDMIGKLGAALVKLDGERVDLFLGGHLGGEEEPDEGFEEGLAVSRLAGEGWKDLCMRVSVMWTDIESK